MSELQYEYESVNEMERVKRLLENDDFIKIFINGFMKDDLVFLGMNISSATQEARVKLNEQMIARGVLKQYIDGIITTGVSAKNSIDEYEQSKNGDE